MCLNNITASLVDWTDWTEEKLSVEKVHGSLEQNMFPSWLHICKRARLHASLILTSLTVSRSIDVFLKTSSTGQWTTNSTSVWYSTGLEWVRGETHHPTDTASTDSGLELAVELLDGAGGVEALRQQDDPVQEEERGDAIDDVLHELDSVAEGEEANMSDSLALAFNK